MHFLCLHGMGTNSDIFKVQTAAIRYRLGPEHTYEFVDGSYSSPPAPGLDRLLSQISSSAADIVAEEGQRGKQEFGLEDSEFCAYLSDDPNEVLESARSTLLELKEYIELEGPFDGVMAFSQGAGIAACLMIQQAQQNLAASLLRPILKCAVFFSGGVPADPACLEEGKEAKGDRGQGRLVRLMNKCDDGVVIRVPTAHIWGKNDELYPDFGPVLADLSNENNRETVRWEGGHEIPGLSGGNGIEEAVAAIKRTIQRASADQ